MLVAAVLLIVVSVLVGLVPVLWVAFQAGRDQRATSSLVSGASPLWSWRGRTFSTISVADAFEPDTAILWETQLSALDLICAAGARGLPAATLREWYLRSVRRYPELYDDFSFESWLDFLSNANLIACDGQLIRATSSCVQFLKAAPVA